MLRFQLRCFHFHWLFVLLQGATIVSCFDEHHFCRVFVCPNMGYTGVYRPFKNHLDKLDKRSWFRGAMLKKFGPPLSGLDDRPYRFDGCLPVITAAKTIPFHGKVIKKWIHDDTCGYWIPPTSPKSMVNGQFIHLCHLGSLTGGFPWALAIVGNLAILVSGSILPGL